MAKFSDLRNRILYAVTLAVIGVACLLTKPTTTIFIATLMVAFIYEVATKLLRKPPPSAKAVLVTAVFAIVGIAGLICAWTIRLQKHGVFSLLLVAFGVAATDIFAYIGGKKYGRRKLAPKISPNKTVEGLFCGLAAGMVALWVTWGALRASSNTSLTLVAIGCMMLLPPIAIMADLLESWSKRLLGIKDFGRTLGAHGGIADRFDAMTAGFIVLLLVMRITS